MLKKSLLKIIFSFVITLFTFFNFVHAKEFLVVGSPIEPPWKYYQNGTDILTGIDIDILQELQKRTKIKFETKTMTFPRSLIELKQGNVDMMIGISGKKAQNEGLKVSPWAYIDNIITKVYVLNTMQAKIHKYEDMYSYTIGIIKNFNYDERFDDDPLLRKELSEDVIDLFKKLASGYIDAIVATDWEKNYVMPQITLNNNRNIISQYSLNKKNGRYIAYSKNVSFYQIKLIEDTMDEMIEDGTIAKILDKYTIKEEQKQLEDVVDGPSNQTDEDNTNN